MEKKLLRAFEVPELKQFGTRSTITRWLTSGALEGRKIAGRWWTTEQAVCEFLKGTSPAQAPVNRSGKNVKGRVR